MSLFTKSLEEVNVADLQYLVAQKFAEWKTVEYKQTLSANTDLDRKKFLSQMCSFANAAGGHLIYGMRAAGGVPLEVCGLDLDNPDGMILRLEDMTRDGIRPRIPAVQFRAIPVKEGKVTIVIRIPRSWALPHQVVFNKEFRFFSRSSNGKYILDVEELRSLFNLSATAAERIRRFRAERLSMMVAGETPVTMADNSKTVLHLVPLSAFDAFDASARFDLTTVAGESNLLQPISAGGWSAARHNFDGIYTVAEDKGLAYSYVQVFRNGIIETVNSSLLDPKYDNRKLIPSLAYEKALHRALARYLALEKRLRVNPPIVVLLSLLGVKGYVMAVDPNRRFDDGRPIDRDALLVPEVLVESLEADVDDILRLVCDPIWNAAGWPGSINFNKDGKWASDN